MYGPRAWAGPTSVKDLAGLDLRRAGGLETENSMKTMEMRLDSGVELATEVA